MDIEETGFDGLLVLKPAIFSDSRGYFFESFRLDFFKDSGINFFPVQDNESKSSKGVIRGLHYQLRPYDQAKLIRVVSGRIFDVVVDLRRASSGYGKWFGIELDSDTRNQLFIPRGFAHGFSVLSETAVIQYKCDNTYNKSMERGINLRDPFLAIDWRLGKTDPLISDKDLNHPSFEEAEKNF